MYSSQSPSEDQFRSALENSPLAASIVGLHPDDLGRFLWVNGSFATLLGYEPDQLLSMSFRDITHPDELTADDEGLADVLLGSAPWAHGVTSHPTIAGQMVEVRSDSGHVAFTREKRYVTSDGRTLWVRIHGSSIGGGRPRYLAQIEDLTAEHEATRVLTAKAVNAELSADMSAALTDAGLDEEAALSAIAERLATTIGEICIVSQITRDYAGRVLAARGADPVLNEMAQRFLCLPEVRISPMSGAASAGQTLQSHGDELLASVSPGTAGLLKELGIHTGLLIPLQGGGETIGALVLFRRGTAPPFTDDEVDLLGDLAERVALVIVNARLHASIAESEEQFRSAMENSPLGVTIVSMHPDDAGRYLWVNTAFAEMLGYDREALLGKTFRDVTHPYESDLDEEYFARISRGETKQFRREKRYVTSDGRTVWARASVSPITGPRPSYLAQIEDITAQREAEEDLAFKAMHDSLTGLANRNLFLDHLRLALGQLERAPGTVGVLYLDIDHFKEINDKVGHDGGDQILREAARRLSSCVRGPDTVARVGGDEFVIVCPAIADATDASRVAERIMSGFKVPFAAAGRELDVAISIGVATTSSPTMDANELVRRADQALYEAKDKGRRRWQIYQEAMQRSALRRLGIQDDIRAALEAGHMRLHYQPVVDMRTGQVVGAEALVRMQHPQRGLVLPDEFIDVAEDSELIIPLGDWVLEQVCAQIAEWSQGPGFRLAMNVSSRQVMDLVSFDKVFDAAAAAGIELSCLGLEMTERVLIEGGDSVIGRLRRLTEAGVGLAIDDFGTGYSSLSYLHRFPVDTLKIDKSFIHGLVANRADTAIVEALVQLSDTLGLTVIAEGVEDEQQAAALRRIGCHLVQGYLFGRPQPPEVISGMLRARSPAAG